MSIVKRLWFWIAVISLTAAGCATSLVAENVPLLKLSPVSLGRELAMTQQLVVQTAGQSVVIDVALEVDAVAVHMAMLQFGRTLARLEWDGQQLTRTLGSGWPDRLLAECVLNDIQLVWWPADAVRAALPAGWALEQTADSRILRHSRRTVVAIELPQAGTIVIRHPLEGYTVQVRTDDQSPIFDSIADKP